MPTGVFYSLFSPPCLFGMLCLFQFSWLRLLVLFPYIWCRQYCSIFSPLGTHNFYVEELAVHLRGSIVVNLTSKPILAWESRTSKYVQPIPPDSTRFVVLYYARTAKGPTISWFTASQYCVRFHYNELIWAVHTLSSSRDIPVIWVF